MKQYNRCWWQKSIVICTECFVVREVELMGLLCCLHTLSVSRKDFKVDSWAFQYLMSSEIITVKQEQEQNEKWLLL